MTNTSSSYEHSFEEDFDIPHLINFGNTYPPKNNKVLRMLLNLLNINIITYNANLNKYKELAVFLEKYMTLAHTKLVSTYVETVKYLARLISLDMQNSVSSDYTSLLSYFKTLFRLHASNLLNEIKQIQEHVLHMEEILKVSGWLLIQGIWMVNHSISLQDRPPPPPPPPPPPSSPSHQQQNISGFILAMSRETLYINGICQKIIKKFENIYWLYEYLWMTSDMKKKKNKNRIWDLDTFVTTQLLGDL